jgi:hypothetical protein
MVISKFRHNSALLNFYFQWNSTSPQPPPPRKAIKLYFSNTCQMPYSYRKDKWATPGNLQNRW